MINFICYKLYIYVGWVWYIYVLTIFKNRKIQNCRPLQRPRFFHLFWTTGGEFSIHFLSRGGPPMHEGSCMRRVAREDGWPWWWVRMEVAEGVYRKADIGLLRKTKTGFFEERISGGLQAGGWELQGIFWRGGHRRHLEWGIRRKWEEIGENTQKHHLEGYPENEKR